jgi:glycosyltransferase involved in cell wall biosynthesis
VKLLFLLPSVPAPANAGAKMRNHGLLRLASQEHEVHALAFGAAEDQARLASLVRRAQVVPLPPERALRERGVEMLTSGLPDMARRLWSTDFLAALQQLLASERYDAVQAEGIEMAPYLHAVALANPCAERPWHIYDAHNAEFLLQRRAFEGAGLGRPRGALRAVYSLVQWQRLARFEGAVVRRSHQTLAVSYHDANQLEALAPGEADVRVVPNGIDLAAYPFRLVEPEDPPALLFVGKLDFRPNADALAWLVHEVLPRLHAHQPRVRLFVVGDQPPAWVVQVGQRDNRVAVTGAVADERPYFERATASLLPMRVGGGSRLKALVSFASGVPVVSTRPGMEGLDAEPARDFVLADSADEWAHALAALIRDREQQRRLAESGRALVQQCYDWQVLAGTLREAYRSLGEAAP